MLNQQPVSSSGHNGNNGKNTDNQNGLRSLYEMTWLQGHRDRDPQTTDALLHHLVHATAPQHLPATLQGKVTTISEALSDDVLTGFVTGRTGDCMIAVQAYRALSYDLTATNPNAIEIEGFEGTGRALTKDKKLVPAGILFTEKNPNDVLKGLLDLEMLRRAAQLTRIINQVRLSAGQKPIRGASNATRFLLERKNFASEILEILAQSNLPPSQCTLELLEDIGQLSPHQIDQLMKLERAGVMISMDDFGESGSEATFRQLTASGLAIGEMKFDGKMTRSIHMRENGQRATTLLTDAYHRGVRICVWEGDVQGVDQSHISAAKEISDGFLESHPGMHFLFEGSTTPT